MSCRFFVVASPSDHSTMIGLNTTRSVPTVFVIFAVTLSLFWMDEESFFSFQKKGTLPSTKVEHYPFCPVGGSGFENRSKKKWVRRRFGRESMPGCKCCISGLAGDVAMKVQYRGTCGEERGPRRLLGHCVQYVPEGLCLQIDFFVKRG